MSPNASGRRSEMELFIRFRKAGGISIHVLSKIVLKYVYWYWIYTTQGPLLRTTPSSMRHFKGSFIANFLLDENSIKILLRNVSY
jgi:hypothetical protein